MPAGPAGGPPHFLVIGHIVRDLLSDEDADRWRLGGAAAYASLLARSLGLRTAALTAAAPGLDLERYLPEVELSVVPSPQTTRIRNVYEGGRRRQTVPTRAVMLTAEHLPDEWRESEIVLLGPVAGEVDDSLAGCFRKALVGVGAQGWLREIGPDGRVRPVAHDRWDAPQILRHADALFVSDEDVAPDDAPAALAAWSALVDIVCFTRGYNGADICYKGEWRSIAAFPSSPLDLTGAGDAFAAAFLVRYAETHDPWESARFASAAAAFVVEGEGIAGIPTRAQVEERLRAHPEIVAR